ncbi:lipoprotein [Rhizobacter sp. Root404]|uniref:LPS translocon maturation chaperone LptM n=1 Tax=Rhizobacter sp. Root404 TaxID=1736528 RepID=UPI0012F89048
MLQRKISVAAAAKAVSAVGSCLALTVSLTACGQKGPLSLPKPATPVIASQPASAPPTAPAR